MANARLITARNEHGLTQEEAAEALGVSVASIIRWEKGKLPKPYHRQLICRFYNKAEEHLFPSAEQPAETLPDALSKGISTSPRQSNLSILPFLPPLLIGREKDLTSIRDAVLAGRSISVTGMPGIGKTALVSAVARDPEVQAAYDGVLWAEPGCFPSILEQLSRWGKLLGLSEQETAGLNSIEQWKMALRIAIGTQKLLLIIDDVWDITHAQVFFVGGETCVYLVTTRHHQIAIDASPGHVHKLQELSTDQGLTLLRTIAPAAVEAEPQQSLDLVSAVGGLPFALTLMGHYLLRAAYTGQPRRIRQALVELQQMEIRLRLQGFSMSFSSHPNASNKASLSLLTLIGRSDQAISAEARRALYALTLFSPKPHHFSEEAACAVAQVSPAVLDELVDAGLLEATFHHRYMLHQTITDYGRKMQSILDSRAAARRLLSYTLIYLQAHQQDDKTLVPERAMILTALEAALTLGNHAEFVSMVLLFAPCALAQGWLSLAEQHLKRAYEIASSLEDTSDLALILLYQGQTQQRLGHHQEAIVSWQTGLPFAKQHSNEPVTCMLLASLCWLYFLRGAYTCIAAALSAGLPLALRIGHQESVCLFLRVKGLVDLSLGNYAEGELAFFQGLPLALLQGNQQEIPFYYLCLSARPSRRGNYSQAEDYFQQGLKAASRAEDKLATALLLTYRVSMYTVCSPGPYLRADLQRALDLVQNIPHQGYRSLILKVWGYLELALGYLESAQARVQESLRFADQLQLRGLRGELLTCLAQIALVRGDTTSANTYLSEALPLVRFYSNIEELGRTFFVRGEIALTLGQIEAAKAAFGEFLAVAPVEHAELQALVRFGLARCADAAGQRQEARKQAEESLRFLQQCDHYRLQEVQSWLQARTNPLRRLLRQSSSQFYKEDVYANDSRIYALVGCAKHSSPLRTY